MVLLAKISAANIGFTSDSIRLNTGLLSIDSNGPSFSIRKVNFKAGNINEFVLSELIYPDNYIWKDKAERKKSISFKGFGYFDDNYALFLSPYKRFSLGSYISFKGFSLSFLKYNKGERGDDIYFISNNRGGFEGENILLKYSNSFFLLRAMTSFARYNELSIFYTLALSYKALTISSSFGKINYLDKENNPKTFVLTADINTSNLNISFTYSKGSEPFIGGSYRNYDITTNVKYRFNKSIVKSEYNLSFSPKGRYSKSFEYELLLNYFGIKLDNKLSFTYIFKKDYFRFESNLKTFTVVFNLDKERFSIYLSLSSDFVIKTSVTINLDREY